MTWREDARARLGEKLAVDEALAKLRAMTGADETQMEQMTAQAQRLARSVGAPLSAALETMAEQIAFPRPATPAPLAALRAEVVALRDENHGTLAAGDMYTGCLRYGRRVAYQAVLDLIDKHAREGQ